MIPDDGVIIIRQRESCVSSREEYGGVVYAAARGFPGSFDADAMAHTKDHTNPHEVRALQIHVPSGSEGRWLKLSGSAVEITDEQPIFIEDIHAPVSNDELVKTDENGTRQRLEGVISAPFHISGGKLRLRGDDRIGRRVFFGTDAAGTMGLNLVPGRAVIP